MEFSELKWKILRSASVHIIFVFSFALYIFSFVGRDSRVFFHCSFCWFVVLCCANVCSDHDRPQRIRLYVILYIYLRGISGVCHAPHTIHSSFTHSSLSQLIFFLKESKTKSKDSEKLSSAHNELWAFWQRRSFGRNSVCVCVCV